MNKKMLRETLRYVLMPGNPGLGSPFLRDHNLAFDFWMKFWTSVFEKLGQGERPRADEFLRQDLISVLFHGDKVVAIHCYSFFDLHSHGLRSHSYFTGSYTPSAMAEMEKRDVRNTMSFEYFSVAPEWRGGAVGISIAALLLNIGFEVFERSRVDVALGVCRVDLGVAKLCYDAGGIPLDRNLTLHGVPCDLVGILQGTQTPYDQHGEAELAKHFWSRRSEPAQTLPLLKAA